MTVLPTKLVMHYSKMQVTVATSSHSCLASINFQPADLPQDYDSALLVVFGMDKDGEKLPWQSLR